MKSLVITSDKEKDIELIKSMAERLGVSITILSDDEKEDLAMIKAIEEGKQTPLVSEEEIMKEIEK